MVTPPFFVSFHEVIHKLLGATTVAMALSPPLKFDIKLRAVVLVDALMEYVQLLDSARCNEGSCRCRVRHPITLRHK